VRALIVDALRTPRGKAKDTGGLHGVKPVELVKTLVDDLRARTAAPNEAVDEMLLGCVTAIGDQGSNIAKVAALYAGLGEQCSGSTVNRFCASGLDAIASAAMQIECGVSQVALAGGVESMSRVPMFSDKGCWFADPEVAAKVGFVHMALAADLVANLAGLAREQLEDYALRSHRLAAAAERAGDFARSIVPVAGLTRDELIRDSLSKDKLATMQPLLPADAPGEELALKRYPELTHLEHRHTVATSPGIADGASLALLASEEAARTHGWQPRARVLAIAHRSVEPVAMLTGNVDASKLAIERAGLQVDDVDLFEVNESFAAVPLHFAQSLDLPLERLNIKGGAIAMGHPLGATGGVLLSTLIDNLEERDARTGVVSICGGAGVATALAVERL
jgi:acetyl-CoA C-acetyltransferase